jgi:RimJ/RimL family protein N-acetyltransferase
MKVIDGKDVDLIEPYPLNEVHRIIAWLHCHKMFIVTDDGPKAGEEQQTYLMQWFQQPNVRSWGMIDRNNKLNIKHEAPLIGFIAFEYSGIRNGYFHCATTRRAWGSGMIDEAANMVIKTVFDDTPSLTRVSSFVINNNKAAKHLARRIGMSVEGVIEDAVIQDGVPKAVIHLGLTRTNWINTTCQSQHSSPQSLEQPELV